MRRGGGGRARRQRLRLQRPTVHSSTFDAARYPGGQDGGRRSVRLEPCVRAPAAARGDRSPAGGLTRHRPGERLHHRAAEGDRARGGRAAVRGRNAARHSENDEPVGGHPGCEPGAAADDGALRHEAVSPVPFRRSERRGVERRDAPRARARAEGSPERVHDRAGVLRRGGSGARVGRHRPHLRQPALRRCRAAGRAR